MQVSWNTWPSGMPKRHPKAAEQQKIPAWQKTRKVYTLDELLEMEEIPAWLQGPAADGHGWYWCRACWTWADDQHLAGQPHAKKEKQGMLLEAGEWWGSKPFCMMSSESNARDANLQDAGLLDGVTVMEKPQKANKEDEEEEEHGIHALVGVGLKKLLAMDEIPAWLQGPAADGNWFCRMCSSWADFQHLTSAKGKHQRKLNNGVAEQPEQWSVGMDVENMTNKCKARDLKLFEDGILDKKHVAAMFSSSSDDDSSEATANPGQRAGASSAGATYAGATAKANPGQRADAPLEGRLGMPILTESVHERMRPWKKRKLYRI